MGHKMKTTKKKENHCLKMGHKMKTTKKEKTLLENGSQICR